MKAEFKEETSGKGLKRARLVDFKFCPTDPLQGQERNALSFTSCNKTKQKNQFAGKKELIALASNPSGSNQNGSQLSTEKTGPLYPIDMHTKQGREFNGDFSTPPNYCLGQ